MDEMELELESESLFENDTTALGFGDFELEGEDVLGENFFAESEGDYELDSEFEDYESEQFFGGLLKKALPIAGRILKTVAPKIASAVGGQGGGGLLSGLFGGGGGGVPAGAMPPMGDVVGGNGGYAAGGYGGGNGYGGDAGGFGGDDFGFGGDFESADMESDLEAAIAAPQTTQQALGQAMTVIAGKAATNTEAAAQMGAAVMLSLTPEDRRSLEGLIPSLLRAATILTTALRATPQTRVLMPIVPATVKATVTTVKKRAAATGQKPTPKAAAVAMGKHVRRALQPDIAARAVGRARKTAKKIATQAKKRPQAFAY